MKLIGKAWLTSLASMALYLMVLLGGIWLRDRSGGKLAELTTITLLAIDALGAFASVLWFAGRAQAADRRMLWIGCFGIWQLMILGVAAFVSLVSLSI
jgi:hypothetical protein